MYPLCIRVKLSDSESDYSILFYLARWMCIISGFVFENISIEIVAFFLRFRKFMLFYI